MIALSYKGFVQHIDLLLLLVLEEKASVFRKDRKANCNPQVLSLSFAMSLIPVDSLKADHVFFSSIGLLHMSESFYTLQ